MLFLSEAGKAGGALVLSGLLIEDQEDMVQLATQNGWNFEKQKQMNGWISLLFNRN
jgi:ribosomal protein L11 methylase PrmA